MERSLTVRIVSYSLLTLLAAALIVPSVAGWLGRDAEVPTWFKSVVSKKILLGLDLQGGLHLVYEVQVDKAVSDKADRLASDIEEKLRKEKKITEVRADREGNAEIILRFKDPTNLAKLDREFMRDYQKYLYEDGRNADKGEVRFKIEGAYVDELRDYAIRQGVETIRNRVDKLAVAEPTIIRKGTDIVVELPGLLPEDFERVKKLIGRTAQLEFKMIDDGSAYMRKLGGVAQSKKAEFPGIEVGNDFWQEREAQVQHSDVFLKSKDRSELEKFIAGLSAEDKPPADHEIGYELMPERERDVDDPGPKKDPVWRTYYLHRRAELTGEYITDAEVGWDQQTGRPEVLVQFDREGANLFEKASGQNIGRKMAIILDEKVTSAPVIETKIGGGRARITMGGSGDPFALQQEAKDLVAVLRTGALPAPLKKTFETQVGPTLGRDAVDKAKLSMIIGSLAVILLMLVYYRMAGLIANVAMGLNILYQLAILALLGATLTLPGIAGVVLTVGMAVDANIIFYERIREEMRAGKSVRGAVDAGFGRAFVAVFDAHVTNLVAGIVLYSYGTGPIRGFAVTLMIGVIANLFTSVWLSRAMFDALLSGKPKSAEEGKKLFGTMELIPPNHNYDFVGKMKGLLVVSVSLCVLSLLLLPINHYVRGRALNFSIDFRGGSEVQIAFSKDADPAAIRSAMSDGGFHDAEVVKITDAHHPNSYLLRFGSVSTVSTAKAKELEAGLKAKFGDTSLRRFEFSDGGDKIYARFNKAIEPNDIAGVFKEKGVQESAVQRFGRPEENNYEIILVGLDQEVKRALDSKLGAGSVEKILAVESVGAKAGAELRDDGIKSLLFAILCIMIYVAVRFDFRYGPGTVVALLHDALLTMGAFALTGREFSLTTIAAILTVIGFSMNDTIVVFDRIREDASRLKDKKFEQICNTAVNETMSRTILTSATVFFVTLAMNVFGTGVIRDFAFAMNVGVIVGTYSSVFVATPVLIWLANKAQQQTAKSRAKAA